MKYKQVTINDNNKKNEIWLVLDFVCVWMDECWPKCVPLFLYAWFLRFPHPVSHHNRAKSSPMHLKSVHTIRNKRIALPLSRKQILLLPNECLVSLEMQVYVSPLLCRLVSSNLKSMHTTERVQFAIPKDVSCETRCWIIIPMLPIHRFCQTLRFINKPDSWSTQPYQKLHVHGAFPYGIYINF